MLMINYASKERLQMETTCDSLRHELKVIWDEVGESDGDREKMLLELELECLEVYRRKLDHANLSRARLRQAIADAEAEIAAICSTLGEPPLLLWQSNRKYGSLKEVLEEITTQLEEMRRRKNDRRNELLDILEQIKSIQAEIRHPEYNPSLLNLDDSDLSIRKLEDLYRQLQLLQKEKADRVQQVHDLSDNLKSICLVLAVDFKHTISEVHPSLDEADAPKSISNDTIEKLASEIQRLREVKMQRMQELQDLATTMLELWNLMDTPMEEQQIFQNVTCNIAASEHEITEPNTLSLDFINYVEAEVLRLEALKSSKMKELVLKKKAELHELCRRTHLVTGSDDEIGSALDTSGDGAVDPSILLGDIELQVSTVKEEAFSRKEILERVEKWLSACEEESWLEEYNRDENRYNAGRGTHRALRRAEKARATVSKIPAIVEALVGRITAWEKERGAEFIYDGVALLPMLEEYMILRQEKEQDRKRERDHKRLQGQLLAEKEVLYGSKPSLIKSPSLKKSPRTPTGRRRVSPVGANLQSAKTDSLPAVVIGKRGPDCITTPRKPFVPLVSDSNMPSTPSKLVLDNAEEVNKTPRTMQLAATPRAVCRAASPEMPEEIEYSFEERRAGFVMPQAQQHVEF